VHDLRDAGYRIEPVKGEEERVARYVLMKETTV
jgi:hypothetical protein